MLTNKEQFIQELLIVFPPQARNYASGRITELVDKFFSEDINLSSAADEIMRMVDEVSRQCKGPRFTFIEFENEIIKILTKHFNNPGASRVSGELPSSDLLKKILSGTLAFARATESEPIDLPPPSVSPKIAWGAFLHETSSARGERQGVTWVPQHEAESRLKIAEEKLDSQEKWFAEELKRIGVTGKFADDHEAEPFYLINTRAENLADEIRRLNEARETTNTKEIAEHIVCNICEMDSDAYVTRVEEYLTEQEYQTGANETKNQNPNLEGRTTPEV
jgi:hypothetical protein